MYNAKSVFWLKIIVVILCNLLFSIILCLLTKPTSNAIFARKNLENSSYKFMGKIPENGVYMRNSYYANIDYISFVDGQGSYILCDNLMTLDGIDYGGNYLTSYGGIQIEDCNLLENECAISSNLSSLFHVDVHDVIKVKINFEEYFYHVKYIFDSYYGMSDIDLFNNIGLIVMGYNSAIIEDAQRYDLVEFTEQSILFSDEDIQIKEKTISYLKDVLYYLCGIIIFVFFLASILIEHFFSGVLQSDLKVLQLIGISKRRILFYNVLDAFYKYFIIYFIPFICLLIYASKIRADCLMLLMIVGFCFVLSMVYSIARSQIILRRKLWKNMY